MPQPIPNLKDTAIKLALENNWEAAITVNKQLLDENPHDIGTLNRLSYAYMQSGKFEEAKNSYNRILELDTTNPIATKNLRKLMTLSSRKSNSNLISHLNHMDNVFIQEAGKTKTVDLLNIADRKTLTTLQNGDNVTLTIKLSKIFAITSEKAYIGMLPDNVGIRLIYFMKGGNEYQACIKGVDDKNITLFIKETKRAKKYSDQSSF